MTKKFDTQTWLPDFCNFFVSVSRAIFQTKLSMKLLTVSHLLVPPTKTTKHKLPATPLSGTGAGVAMVIY